MDLSQIPIEWLMLIPPKYLALLVLFFGSPTTLAGILWVAKKLTGVPQPDDVKARQRWFKVLSFLDKLAINSPLVKCQLQTMQHRQELEEHRRELLEQQARLRTQSAVIKELQQ